MFRKVKPPVYTNVYRDETGVFGVVEYDNAAEVREIIRELRDCRFKNPWEECKVRLVDDTPGARKSGRDSRSRSRSRDRSLTPKRDRSASPAYRDRSTSRGRSPARSLSRYVTCCSYAVHVWPSPFARCRLVSLTHPYCIPLYFARRNASDTGRRISRLLVNLHAPCLVQRSKALRFPLDTCSHATHVRQS